MKSKCTALVFFGLFLVLSPRGIRAQPEDAMYMTLLSSPGKLEIVRHPPAADYTRMISRGKLTSLPSYQPESERNWQVDIRSCNLSSLDLMDRLEDLLYADYDSRTIWPELLPSGFDVEHIMDLGKNPGLGLRDIHKQGITGTGVGVAIIDQALLVNHVEYKDRLRLYEEIHWRRGSEAEMHGPAVASIAVGQNVGVAPGADLYYIAEWHARSKAGGGFEFELTPLAQAIDRIVEINRSLLQDRRIRVISISLGINSRMNAFDLVKEAILKAEKAGIYTVYVGSEQFMGLGRSPLTDPDEIASYGPGLFWKKSITGKLNSLMVPMDSRCTAAPNGDSDYAFYRSGGMSWSVPWVAGLYALACQEKPDITPQMFWQVARETGVVASTTLDGKTQQYGRIINPKDLLRKLK